MRRTGGGKVKHPMPARGCDPLAPISLLNLWAPSLGPISWLHIWAPSLGPISGPHLARSAHAKIDALHLGVIEQFARRAAQHAATHLQHVGEAGDLKGKIHRL